MDTQLHPFGVKCATQFKLPHLQEALVEFDRRITSGQAALTICGLPDTGKSTLMLYLLERLTAAKSAVVYHMVMADSAVDEKQFFRELLTSNGSKEAFPSITPKEALIRSAQTEARKLGTQRVVFLIDEAQMMTKKHLELMRGLMAQLTALRTEPRLAPFTCLFAAPEILLLLARAKDRTTGDASLVNRFLGRSHRYRGMKLSEFRLMMQMVDQTRFPESGPTYTEHWAPSFWARGGRLEAWTDAFANEFQSIATAYGRDTNDIPASYLTNALHNFLTGVEAAPLNPAETQQLVASAVAQSGAAQGFEFLGGLEQSMLDAPSGPVPKSRGRNQR